MGPTAPIAGFTYERDFLNVSFTDTSTDVNGDIVSRTWDFGDGNTSTDTNPMHSYAAAGTYAVSLTTVDSEGLSNTKTDEIQVSEVNIELAVKRANKSRTGYMRVELTWQGAAQGTVDVYRNGELLNTVENKGVYRDIQRQVE